MKKVFFALAIAAMFSFVACGNEEPATADTNNVEAQIEEPTVNEDETVNAEATECTENAEGCAEKAEGCCSEKTEVSE